MVQEIVLVGSVYHALVLKELIMRRFWSRISDGLTDTVLAF